MFKNSKFFKKFEPPSMIPPLDIYWKKAKGAHIWDDKGKKYIDFTSTIFVTSIGHGNNHFKNKIKEVLNSMSLYLGMEIPNWPPENIAELSKKLEDNNT